MQANNPLILKLEKGIFFEDTNSLLQWGEDVEEIALKNNAIISRPGDRTVVNWGTHIIFSGLELKFISIYLLEMGPHLYEKFQFIEHWTIGDKESFETFDLISQHLLSVIGDPILRDDGLDKELERNWIWKVQNVEINLFLFEQHASKLNFRIKQL